MAGGSSLAGPRGLGTLSGRVPLGLRPARYRECLKTETQRLLTATVAHLTRIWAQAHPENHPWAAAPGPDGERPGDWPDPQLRSRSVAGDTAHRAASETMASPKPPVRLDF